MVQKQLCLEISEISRDKLSRMNDFNFSRVKLSRKWPKFAKFEKASPPKVSPIKEVFRLPLQLAVPIKFSEFCVT